MHQSKRNCYDETSVSSTYPTIEHQDSSGNQPRQIWDNEYKAEFKKRKILVIGAGVSGILLAHHFQKYLSKDYEFTVLEKNADVGGTWLENSYPGCACDVPSDIYQFSFAPTSDWSTLYASSAEIQRYLGRVVDHFDLRQYVRFQTKVEGCEWHEEKKRWITTVKSADDQIICYESDILINAGGFLNNYKFPEIAGLQSFEGTLMHTANWDHSINLSGKKVAVIGAGASAVQAVPALDPIVDKLFVYIRTPAWITQPIIFNSSNSSQQHSKKDPDQYLKRCKEFEDYYNKLFPIFRRGSNEQVTKQKEFASRMCELIKDPALQKMLVPTYELGCRRINPGESFLSSLQKENVSCIFERIVSCTPGGLVTENGVCKVDIIIAATGFDTSFRPRFPLIGRGGIDMRELWKDDPVSYMGIGCSGFPNYLTMLGPNCPVANGSLIGSLEATASFLVRLLKRMAKLDVASFSPNQTAQDEFNDHVSSYMKDMVWTGNCTSWYKRGYDGKVTAIWPGSSLHYIETLEENRWEDWDWDYLGSRYKSWGDGTSIVEKTGGDYSYYLSHGPFLPNIQDPAPIS